MAFLLGDVQTRVNAFLKDAAGFLTTAEKDEHINSGLEELNRDRPLTIVKDINGDGTQDYNLPTEFQKSFSIIKSVETPAGETPPVFRDRDDDWFIYEDPTKVAADQDRLRFKESTPTSTEIIRVVLTTPHTLTVSATTLDQTGFVALSYKAAALSFRALAARFMQSTDSTLEADAVNYEQQASNYLFVAERYNTNYKQLVGQEGKPPAAQALLDADVLSRHGEPMLWHPARRR